MNFSELKISLNNTISIPKSEPEVLSRAHETFLGVSSRKISSGDRSNATILRDCYYGTMREFGVARLISGSVNDQIPDFKTFNKNTYGWDVSVGDLKLEIKPQAGEYFSVSNVVAERLNNNSKIYDYIVSAEVREETETILVIPRMIIKSEDFPKYTKKSKYNSWQLYYNHRAGPCTILNLGI